MGIKLFAFMRRRPGMTPAEFHAYWRDEHAARLARTPEMAKHVRRFELNHRLTEDYAREPHDAEVASGDYDGVAVLWFDSMDRYRALMDVAKKTPDDAPAFRQADPIHVFTNDADVIVDHPRRRDAKAKLLCILRRHPSLDLDTFHSHWLHNHGGLFQNVAELREPLWGYDQNHGIGGPDAAYDGVTEQWFEDLPHWVESLSAPAHATTVEPDVAYFLDPDKIHFVIAGQPSVIIDG